MVIHISTGSPFEARIGYSRAVVADDAETLAPMQRETHSLESYLLAAAAAARECGSEPSEVRTVQTIGLADVRSPHEEIVAFQGQTSSGKAGRSRRNTAQPSAKTAKQTPTSSA